MLAECLKRILAGFFFFFFYFFFFFLKEVKISSKSIFRKKTENMAEGKMLR